MNLNYFKILLVSFLFILVSYPALGHEEDVNVGKGNFRAGLMGSFQKGRLAGSLFNSVSSFTLEGEFEYFLTDSIAPITRMSTTVAFLGEDSITDFVWGAGLKGIYNFRTRYIAYIKFIPSVHVFNYDLESTTIDGLKDNSVNFDILAGAGLDILLTKNVAIGFAFHYEVIFADEKLDVYSVPIGFSFYF